MERGGASGPVSREALIGIGTSAIALVAMASDHLLGDEPGLEDPAAFAVSSAVVLGLAALLFGVAVPRARAVPRRAARTALACSALALLGISLLFVGVPFPLAGAGVALGLAANEAGRRASGLAAVALGVLVLAFAIAYYLGEAFGAW